MYQATLLSDETNALVLDAEPTSIGEQNETRPVFAEEMDLLGFGTRFEYNPSAKEPFLWAIGRQYYYRGQLVATAVGGHLGELPNVSFVSGATRSLKPADVAYMSERNHKLLEAMAQTAIQTVATAYRRFGKKNEIVVAFSGGKDSATILDLARRALRPDQFCAVFADTQMEIPPTYDYVRAASQQWPDVRILTAKSRLATSQTWDQFGPPSRIQRWCCSVHKSVPTIELIRTTTGRKNVRLVVFDGIRASESLKRGAYGAISFSEKHSIQTNIHPILAWSTSEVYLYLLDRGLSLNAAYRMGLVRVGCAICPLEGEWWESLAGYAYGDTLKPFVEKLKQYARRRQVPEAEVANFVESGDWKNRPGGLGLEGGVSQVLVKESPGLRLILRDPRGDWWTWCTILGPVLRTSESTGVLTWKGEQYEFTVDVHDRSTEISFRTEPNRELINRLKSVAKKAAYCIGCGACAAECPTGSIGFALNSVLVDPGSCSHCLRCVDQVEKGCLLAHSLNVSDGVEGRREMKPTDRYHHFGMHGAWLTDYLSDPDGWAARSHLGPVQFDAMKVWLRDGSLMLKSQPTELARTLSECGQREGLIWSVMWTELAQGSSVVAWYLDAFRWGASIGRDEMITSLGDDRAFSSRKNVVVSLVDLLKYTPLGSSLGLGVVAGDSPKTTVNKMGWENPDPLAVLYSLVRMAERIGRRSLTLGEIFETNTDGPWGLFGISETILRQLLHGLSVEFPEYLSVTLVRDLDMITIAQEATSGGLLAGLGKKHNTISG